MQANLGTIGPLFSLFFTPHPPLAVPDIDDCNDCVDVEDDYNDIEDIVRKQITICIYLMQLQGHGEAENCQWPNQEYRDYYSQWSYHHPSASG